MFNSLTDEQSIPQVSTFGDSPDGQNGSSDQKQANKKRKLMSKQSTFEIQPEKATNLKASGSVNQIDEAEIGQGISSQISNLVQMNSQQNLLKNNEENNLLKKPEKSQVEFDSSFAKSDRSNKSRKQKDLNINIGFTKDKARKASMRKG